ncbi:MAG: hypothetical protein H8D63_02560 [Parcubacteria group bacterium]|nr:hypothetical protein [Parcubacteria group bacterium]
MGMVLNALIIMGVILFIYTLFRVRGFYVEEGDNPFAAFAPPIVGALCLTIGVMGKWVFPFFVSAVVEMERAFLASVLAGVVLFTLFLVVGFFLAVVGELV